MDRVQRLSYKLNSTYGVIAPIGSADLFVDLLIGFLLEQVNFRVLLSFFDLSCLFVVILLESAVKILSVFISAKI